MSSLLWTRRAVLHAGTGAALTTSVPARLRLNAGTRSQHPRRTSRATDGTPTSLRDPRIKALALRALDDARSAGASYADVRLTNTISRGYDLHQSRDTIRLGLSVRALVNGYWGWAATPHIAETEASRIGRQAALLASANAASGKPRRVEWNAIPVVQNGDWVSPVAIDPIEVALEEVTDWLNGIKVYIDRLGVAKGGKSDSNPAIRFEKQERLFASTEGSLLTQTTYTVYPDISFVYRTIDGDVRLTPAQAGWEYVYAAPVRDMVRQEMDRIDAELALHLPVKPVDVGRYDVIFAAPAMATLLGATVGAATELDRALGYEANAGGTSYLGPDPFALLGTPIASPLLTVIADRSTTKGLATIQWDDEGVVPDVFPLIQDGILVDYQTTREQAAWIAPWYAKHGRPVRSHGCAASVDALTLPMQHTPNLAIRPGVNNYDLEDIVASLDHGLLIGTLRANMDFQHSSGMGFSGDVTEVRHGRRVARIGNAAFLFHAPELWKNVRALGGPKSLQWFGTGWSAKGEPGEGTEYSIAAVPALVQQIALINPMKRA